MVTLSATGYIQVRAYESYAQIPLEKVAIAVTATDGTAIAMRLTDRSGRIEPIALTVPDKSESLYPDPPEKPFANVDLHARLSGYEQITVEDLQVFADTVTDQDLIMIPLSEIPGSRNKSELFKTPSQEL